MKSRAALRRLLACCLGLVPLLALAATFPHEGSDLAVDPAVRWGRLENGLRYAVLANKEPKGRASLRLAVAAGALHETEAQRGLAHFLEHMAFNGSTRFPPGTLIEYFQRLGMSFGGDTNAYTGFDRTVYLLELPDTQPATLERALTLFADYAGGLLLEPAEIDRERGIILSEKRARDSVEFRQFIAEFGFMLPEARFIERMPIGLESVISSAPREQFVDFYDAWYRPELITVVAVGDFDPAAVEAQLVQALSPLAARGAARPPPGLGRVSSTPGVLARLHPEPEAAAVNVSIQTITPYAWEPDTAANRLKYLPRTLALRMLNRRLSILARKEGAPFMGGSVAATEQYDFYRSASVEMTCKPEQWTAALAVGEQELRRALVHGFQPAELRESVASFRNAVEQSVRTAPTRRSEALAGELVDVFFDRAVFTHPAESQRLYLPALERVTVDQCLAALRELWPDALGRRIFVTGNLALPDAERQIVAAYEASRAVAVAPPERIEEAAFAYTDFGAPGAVEAQRAVDDLGVTLIEFGNGVRLNLKPTDFEAGRIRVHVRAGGGDLTEPADQVGLSFLTGNTFSLGGLGRHSVDELPRILAGRTVAANFGIASDAFTFSGTTNRQDLQLQLQLLCAFYTDPGFRPEAMRQFEKGVEVFYTRLGNTVQGPIQTDAARLLANGDPRFGVPPKEAVQRYTLADAKAWLARELARAPIEIAIVGDFDPAAAIAAVAQTFGALPPRDPKPDYRAQRQASFPAAPLARQYFVPTEIPKGLVELNWPATDGRDAPLARRLSLLSGVFEDRLRKKLREEMGDTYSPDAGASLSDTFTGYGFLVASATVDPQHARKVADAIKQVAGEIHAGGVTEEELERAKQPQLTAIRQSQRTNLYWLGSVLSAAQEQPERLDWARNRLTDTQSITAAELTALARQYLDPANVHEFISLPVPKQPAP
ncbi:MAG TPA: insulinase family protein [Opitutaceae bacterium]|nr:insulinase family protein [Opitutaceae bacterium]